MDISKKVMLIVDDIETNRAILNEYFQEEYTIIEAENGKEAFEILESQFVDILVTDLYMPVMDGFELITALRQEERYDLLPIIAVTEHNEVIENKVLNLGADDFITKPFATKLLCHRVKGVMSEDRTNARIDQFRFCMDFSPIAFGIVKLIRDNDNNPVDIQYRYVNHSYANLMGYSTTDVIGKKHYELFSQTSNIWLNLLTEVETSGQARNLTYFSKFFQKYFFINAYMETGGFCVFTINDVTEQNVAEERLRESEQKYVLALEGASISAWEYDIEARQILQTASANESNSFPMVIDNVPEVFIESGYVREDSQKDFLELYERLQKGESNVSGEFWVANANHDGWWRKRTTYLVVKDENHRPTHAYGASMDITQSTLAEQNYREEIRYHRQAMSSMLSTCCVNLTKNKVEEINFGESYLEEQDKLYVVDYRERVGKYLTSIHLSDEENKSLGAESLLKSFKHGEQGYSKEYWAISSKTGDIVWIHVDVKMLRRPENGDVVAFYYNRDVTKERMMHSIIQTTIRFDYDYISGINVWNKHFEIYSSKDNVVKPDELSLNYDKMVEQYMRKVAVTDHIEEVIQSVQLPKILRYLEQEEMYSYEYDMREKDGTIRRKMVRYAYADREKGLVINTRTDIADIVNREKEKQDILEHALEIAEQASLAKSDFLARMSHDIRTPMNAILGVTALAKENSRNQEMDDYLEKVDSSGRFLLGLINDILDISRIESGKLVMNPDIFTKDEFEEAIDITIRPLMEEKKIAFSYDLNCGVTNIFIDPVRFEQIFFNLLSNAAKYTPEGRTVEFKARALSSNGKIAYIRFWVSDDGIGMSPEFIKRAFEPFEQEQNGSDLQWQGTGLGLTIVKKLVEMMNGTVAIESEPGNGTTIIVDLPLKCVDEDELNQKEQNRLNTVNFEQLKGKRILLVEDNKINTFVARRLLEGKQMEVEHAENGKDALDMFQISEVGRYDAILMDIRMPIMNGLDTARAIRQLEREDAQTVQIFAMTANAYEEDIKKSFEAGMNGHLTKPINPDELYQNIYRGIRAREKDENEK